MLGGELARAVYANGRQYDYIEDLEKSIVAEWDKLSKRYFRNLVRSMPRRRVQVVTARGGSIGY